MYDEKHRIIELSEIAEGGKLRHPQKGHREKLLCAKCESHINHFEKHTRRLFVDPLPPPSMGNCRMREHPRLDYPLSKLFFLSILWRASVSSLPLFRHVKLGPHEEPMRQMILNCEPGETTTYPVTLFPLHLEGDHLRDILVEPTYMRFKGRRCYRFVMAGFVVFIIVSVQSPPDPFPQIAISSTGPVRSYSAELTEFPFLNELWKAAGKVTLGL